MDIRKIRKLIALLKETGISEIEIKEGEESLRLSCFSQKQAPSHHTSIESPTLLLFRSTESKLQSTLLHQRFICS